MDEQTHDKLIADIRADSQWLIRMVENLLAVTRISEASMNLTKSPEAVEEIVSESVSRVRRKFQGCNITVKVPDELLLVPMDATLIEQVIINLLENAIKHSHQDSFIELTVKKSANSAIFEVSDNGKGLEEGISFQESESLRFQLVNLPVEQIDGSIELRKDKGIEFTILFNNIEPIPKVILC
jgi:two-component system sensor histidine kinase KdpD